MTPAEWNSSADPDAMLAAAAARISDRKLLLFGCAAARRVDDILPEFVTTLLPQVEAAADAPTAAERTELLRAAVRSTGSTVAALVSVRSNVPTLGVVRTAATWLRGLEAQGRTTPLLANIASLFTAPFVNRPSPEQAALLRCVAGCPFAVPVFDPAWRTSTVEVLARGIDADAAFDRLPILADALQDAGCADAELLGHLRSDESHARGCWPLDLILNNP